jgi:hypothetical protein
VALVLFCNHFFSSPYCKAEVETVLEEASNGRLLYLPVFFTATTAEVKKKAEEVWGNEQSTQVTELGLKVGCTWMCAAGTACWAANSSGNRAHQPCFGMLMAQYTMISYLWHSILLQLHHAVTGFCYSFNPLMDVWFCLWCSVSTQFGDITGIRHKDERHDGIQVTKRTTILRICQAVRNLLQPALDDAEQAHGAAAATVMADAGSGTPSAVSVLLAVAVAAAAASPTESTAQPAAVSPMLMPMGTDLAATANPVVYHVVALTPLAVQPGPSCVITATSSSLLKPTSPALRAAPRPNAESLVAAAMVAILGYAQVAARRGCVTAVAEVPFHSCSPQQLLRWAQQLSQEVTAAESAAQAWPAVVAASGAGGLVAWCQQGWGACLAPSAADLSSLALTHCRVLPVHNECCSSHAAPSALSISWTGVKGPNPTLLVKQGSELHAVHLPCTTIASSAAAMSRGLTDIVGDMFPDEGMLLLSASTGQYFSSTPEAVLVLDVDKPTAAELNSM